MTLNLVQVILQSISSTLHWAGFYVGIRTLPRDESRQRLWIIASAIVFGAWLFAIVLLASQNVFRNDVRLPRIPLTLIVTLAIGYLFLLSPSLPVSPSIG